MPNFLKPVLALAVSCLIYAGYHYLADAQLLSFIQMRFYNPSIYNSYVKENNTDASLVQNHIYELQDRFSSYLNMEVVRRSFFYNQSADDIFQRSRFFGLLLETTGGLQSVQFVDSNGLRLHYSTSTRDLLSQSADSTAYRNYNEDSQALPFDIVSVPAGGAPKYIMDEKSGRVIFSYPFYDSMDVYRGTALFYVSINSLAEMLIAKNRINVSDIVSVINDPPGLLFGTPETSKTVLLNRVSGLWKTGIQGRIILDAFDSEASFSLIYTRTGNGMFFGRLVNNAQFLVSDSMAHVFNLSMFLTFYLVVFFFFNLKPNPIALVRNRIKRLRENLFEQLYINKTPPERAKWILELEQRREEIRGELKYNLKLKGRMETRVDGIINSSWDELLTVIKSGSGQDIASVPAQARSAETADVEEITEAEEVEEVEALSEAEEIDEIEETEALGEVEEIDEIEEAESLGEAEEIDEIEEIAEIEEAEEAAEADEYDEAEELEEIDEAEEINEEYAAAEPVEIDELEDIEEIEDSGDEEDTVAHKGLLGLASEIGGEDKIDVHGKGLLGLASEIPHDGGIDDELHSDAEKDRQEKIIQEIQVHRGLLALASEIEFNHPVNVEEEPEEDLSAEVDVVSPFSSMFSTLVIEDDDKQEDDEAGSSELKEDSI